MPSRARELRRPSPCSWIALSRWGWQRARGDDRFHREEQEFHQRVRAGFLSLAREDCDRYCVIDATAPHEQVQEQVLAAVMQCLNPR